MAQNTQPSSWLSRLLTCLFLLVLWFLFVGKIDRQEIILGVLSAVVATIAAGIFGVQSPIHFRPTFRELSEIWRIFGYTFSGTWEILKGLAIQLFTKNGAPSLIRAVEYQVGGDDPRSVGRRALAVAYTTLTPNFVVLGIIPEQRILLYHQILPGEVLQMTINLGAKP